MSPRPRRHPMTGNPLVPIADPGPIAANPGIAHVRWWAWILESRRRRRDDDDAAGVVTLVRWDGTGAHRQAHCDEADEETRTRVSTQEAPPGADLALSLRRRAGLDPAGAPRLNNGCAKRLFSRYIR